MWTFQRSAAAVIGLTLVIASVDARHLASACAPAFGQCGGKNYNGPTCCEDGSTCMPQVKNGVVNEFYSQCQPNDTPVTNAPPATHMPPPAAPTDLDFLTEQAQRAAFDTLKFDLNTPVIQGPHGSIAVQTVDTSPILATLPGEGVGHALVTLGACAVLQPHVHPRGTELAFVTKGSIVFGLVEELGSTRFLTSTVKAGETFLLPQGLLHFEQNTGCEEVQFTASFPTRDPGTVFAAPSLFGLPIDVLRATLGMDDATIKKTAAAVSTIGVPAVDPECARRCGITV